MSGQLIELILFAGIAFYLINKLIAILGTTSEDDPTKKSSLFGENSKLKDVTPSDFGVAQKSTIIKSALFKKSAVDLKDIAVKENELPIREGLTEVTSRVPSFNIHNFLKGAKVAFQLIIEAAYNNNDQELQNLIDKRYLEQFKTFASSYGEYSNSLEPKIKVSEVYMFGNNIFIKILFAGKNITQKIKNFHEEWTFTKSIITNAPEWYLTNIDRSH